MFRLGVEDVLFQVAGGQASINLKDSSAARSMDRSFCIGSYWIGCFSTVLAWDPCPPTLLGIFAAALMLTHAQ